MRKSAGRAGCTADLVGGVGVAGLAASFIKECTNGVSVDSPSFNATGRQQDLHFMEAVPGGILSRRRACACPQYRQDRLKTIVSADGLAGVFTLITGASAADLTGVLPLSGIG